MWTDGNNKTSESSDIIGLVSADDCAKCPVGQYMDENGHTTTQKNSEDTISCKICDDGMYAAHTGQALCDSCVAGRFLLERSYPNKDPGYHDQLDDCEFCGINSYQTETGKDQCKVCFGNLKINDPGTAAHLHDEAADCNLGGVSCKTGERLKNMISCEICPIGKQVSSDRAFCTLCPTGTYQDTLSEKACKKCTVSKSICALLPGSTSQQIVTSKQAPPPFPIDDEPEVLPNPGADAGTFEQQNSYNNDKCATSRESIRLGRDGVETGAKAAIYSVLAVLASALILSHRFLPLNVRKLDFMFAKAHFIEDTHAMRTLDTRLGNHGCFNL